MMTVGSACSTGQRMTVTVNSALSHLEHIFALRRGRAPAAAALNDADHLCGGGHGIAATAHWYGTRMALLTADCHLGV